MFDVLFFWVQRYDKVSKMPNFFGISKRSILKTCFKVTDYFRDGERIRQKQKKPRQLAGLPCLHAKQAETLYFLSLLRQ